MLPPNGWKHYKLMIVWNILPTRNNNKKNYSDPYSGKWKTATYVFDSFDRNYFGEGISSQTAAIQNSKKNYVLHHTFGKLSWN